jgi:hypothetical protein
MAPEHFGSILNFLYDVSGLTISIRQMLAQNQVCGLSSASLQFTAVKLNVLHKVAKTWDKITWHT